MSIKPNFLAAYKVFIDKTRARMILIENYLNYAAMLNYF